MDAVITVLLPNGDTRSIAMPEFIKGYRQTALQPGEVITSIQLEGIGDLMTIEKSPSDMRTISRRFAVPFVGASRATDWCWHVWLTVALQSDRFVFGDRIATDQQSAYPEFDRGSGRTSKSEVSPLSDVRASARYRQHLVGVLLQDSLEAQLASMSGGEISS